MTAIVPTLDAAIELIADGCMLAVPREVSGVADGGDARADPARRQTAASGGAADLVVAGGYADRRRLRRDAGDLRRQPRRTSARRRGSPTPIKTGAITMKDATCPALYAALEAAEKGIPFMPLRGIIGSDLMAHRSEWRTIDNPFGNNDPIVLLPAIRPDVALFHAPMADSAGNVWIGGQRDLVTLAHASAKTVVTVEEIHDGNLLDDPVLAAGTLPGFYVDAVAVAPRGAWPLPLPDHYAADVAHLTEYARLAATADGFAQYLGEYVHDRRAA